MQLADTLLADARGDVSTAVGQYLQLPQARKLQLALRVLVAHMPKGSTPADVPHARRRDMEVRCSLWLVRAVSQPSRRWPPCAALHGLRPARVAAHCSSGLSGACGRHARR